jgi:hypothetical protein
MLDPQLEQEHNGYTFHYCIDLAEDEGNVYCSAAFDALKVDADDNEMPCSKQELEWLESCEATNEYIMRYHEEILAELQEKAYTDRIEW